MDLIIAHMNTRVEHNYTVLVVIDVVMLDPTEPSFYAEDALASRLVDKVVENDRVG